MECNDLVTIAILAKDKAHVLPSYLELIEKQTYPADKIKLYIRTNNNNDNTAEILSQWIEKVQGRYSEIYFDCSDVEERVQDYGPHDWNPLKLSVLTKLRQQSVEWAKDRGTHYFVVDCDNFITSETLESLMETRLPVIGPLLKNADSDSSVYANFHYKVDANGYYSYAPLYFEVLYQTIKGLIQVEVIHCTYLVRKEVLHHVSYIDGSHRYDYVIFSDTLRKANIPQYIDNRYYYGCLTFCNTSAELQEKNIAIPL